MSKENIKILIGTSLAASITWYINHSMGFGPLIANGIVGVIAASLFNPKFAVSYYTASFVGMSAISVVPSIMLSGLGGLIVGIIGISSPEIYSGMGGKGGTTAAFSTGLVRIIGQFFI